MKKEAFVPSKAALEQFGMVLDLGLRVLERMAAGDYGPKSQAEAVKQLRKMRLHIEGHHAVLMERNEAYRARMEEQFTKRQLDGMMKRSLELNPTKDRNWKP